jgi:hypothetical protein
MGLFLLSYSEPNLPIIPTSRRFVQYGEAYLEPSGGFSLNPVRVYRGRFSLIFKNQTGMF